MFTVKYQGIAKLLVLFSTLQNMQKSLSVAAFNTTDLNAGPFVPTIHSNTLKSKAHHFVQLTMIGQFMTL